MDSVEDMMQEILRLRKEIGEHAVKCDRIVKDALAAARILENGLRQIVIRFDCEKEGTDEKCNCPVCVANFALKGIEIKEPVSIPDLAKKAWEIGQYGLAYGFVCRHPRRIGCIREGFYTGCGECDNCQELERVMRAVDVNKDASCEKMWKDMTPSEKRHTLMNNFETKYPKKTWKRERLDVVLRLFRRSDALKKRGGDVLYSEEECKIVAATLRAEAEDIERGEHEEPYDDE